MIKLFHTWGKISQAIWNGNYPFRLIYEDDLLYGNVEDDYRTDQSKQNDEVDCGLLHLIEGVDGVDMVIDGGETEKVIGDEGDLAEDESDITEDKIICRYDVKRKRGWSEEWRNEVDKSIRLVIKNGWAIQKFGKAKTENVIPLVNIDVRDKKDELKPEPKPVKSAKLNAMSPHSD